MIKDASSSSWETLKLESTSSFETPCGCVYVKVNYYLQPFARLFGLLCKPYRSLRGQFFLHHSPVYISLLRVTPIAHTRYEQSYSTLIEKSNSPAPPHLHKSVGPPNPVFFSNLWTSPDVFGCSLSCCSHNFVNTAPIQRLVPVIVEESEME